jgi:hypothetical protein
VSGTKQTQPHPHTPGPWKAEALAYGSRGAKIRAATGRLILSGQGLAETNLEANAALIAAAPDLAEACAAVVQMVHVVGAGHPDWEYLREKARAALKRAGIES